MTNLFQFSFQCKLYEASVTDPKYYRNLSEFFRRTLRPGVRSIDGAHVLVRNTYILPSLYYLQSAYVTSSQT